MYENKSKGKAEGGNEKDEINKKEKESQGRERKPGEMNIYSSRRGYLYMSVFSFFFSLYCLSVCASVS